VDEPLTEAEIAHKNMLWGWALLGVFCLLFGGTVAVALIYIWLS
jgi:nitrogen fixation protein FixH